MSLGASCWSFASIRVTMNGSENIKSLFKVTCSSNSVWAVMVEFGQVVYKINISKLYFLDIPIHALSEEEVKP